MRTIFVSCQSVDAAECQSLIGHLIDAGFRVSHSPRNPADGDDDRWTNWYSEGLVRELQLADLAIVVVDEDWSSSCWMIREIENIRKLGIPHWIWNPTSVRLPDGGLMADARQLPSSADEVAASLANAGSDRSLPRCPPGSGDAPTG